MYTLGQLSDHQLLEQFQEKMEVLNTNRATNIIINYEKSVSNEKHSVRIIISLLTNKEQMSDYE